MSVLQSERTFHQTEQVLRVAFISAGAWEPELNICLYSSNWLDGDRDDSKLAIGHASPLDIISWHFEISRRIGRTFHIRSHKAAFDFPDILTMYLSGM